MKPLLIEGTPQTPSMRFDLNRGLLEIKGISIPENPVEFYKPLIEWLEQYISKPANKTKMNIHLEYFNTSSSKCFLEIFKKLEVIHKAKHNVVVNWYYVEDDEDMLAAGEDFESVLCIPFNIIETED